MFIHLTTEEIELIRDGLATVLDQSNGGQRAAIRDEKICDLLDRLNEPTDESENPA